jgi:hypothetical protein
VIIPAYRIVDSEYQDVHVERSEDTSVIVWQGDASIMVSPDAARELAQALTDVAQDNYRRESK